MYNHLTVCKKKMSDKLKCQCHIAMSSRWFKILRTIYSFYKSYIKYTYVLRGFSIKLPTSFENPPNQPFRGGKGGKIIS